jgi:hypothetical protein
MLAAPFLSFGGFFMRSMWSDRSPDRARRTTRTAFGRGVRLILLLGLLAYAGSAWAADLLRPLAQDAAAVIASPQSLSSVQGSVSITGSASHPQFQRYELYFTVEPGENWVFIGDAKTTPVNNGLLGTWETTSLPDGNYSLRLRVVRQDGNYDEAFARNIAVANRTPSTPTPTETPAELPTLPAVIEGVFTPTPIVEATSTPVAVEQPEIPTPTPRPSPSPTTENGDQAVATTGDDSSGDSASPSLTDAFDTSNLRSAFTRGLVIAGSIFLAVGAFFGVRRLLLWIWYLIAP